MAANWNIDVSGKSFAEVEYAGWEHAGEHYDDHLGKLTSRVAGPLLDVTDVSPGDSVLEVCCGPGYGVRAALARGAEAVGLDFATSMLESARRLVPEGRFEEGDAQALPYDDACFDAVICPFGLLHVPDAEKALAEAHRVLRPGGGYAYTTWCIPEKVEYFELVMDAIEEHGTLDVPLPDAPPMFRFADPREATQILDDAGFIEPRFEEIPLRLEPKTPDGVLEMIYKSGVRDPLVLQLQTDEARERIHRAIVEGAKAFEKDGRISIGMSAVMGWARKLA